MNRRQTVRIFVLLVVIGLLWFFLAPRNLSSCLIGTSIIVQDIAPAQTDSVPRQQISKKFLYLTQTEKCIREPMRPPSALGNSSVCDVLVLSFMERCNDSSLALPHISYIFNTSTTATTGRSELYYAAKRLDSNYLYYIFIDDDVILEWMHEKRRESPWRSFEQFLLDKEPPLAATDNTYWKIIDKNFAMRKKKGCTMNGTHPDYFLAVWFDATVNAFHYKAIEHTLEAVLPHWHRFDNVSWWFSQWYMNFITDIVFHEQAVLLTQIMGTNPIHRSYPQVLHDAEVLSEIAKDVLKTVPSQYQESASLVLKRWVPSYVEILTTVPETYCHPIPSPHQTITPFKGLLQGGL